ncbi:DUF3040 domain-containing protein [Prauserella oleivorans]|uniref:DUF3040 domain-containing protein n=1 Tax=Prauserella oleivorans TaxID=1478153 RepID=A0ABW5WE09_9PSEU
MLSHYERQELDRIRQRMESDDPELARAFERGAPPQRWVSVRVLRRGLDLFAAALTVLGLVTLNFGLVFLAALVLAGAACAHVAGWGGDTLAAEAAPRRTGGAAPAEES